MSVNMSISKLGKLKNCSQLQPIFVTKTGLLTESVYHEIENIKFVYLELCDVCQNIEDFFGLPAFIAIVKFGEIMTRSLYLVLMSLDNAKPIELSLYIIGGIVIVWPPLILMTLTTFVVRVIKQSQKTANIINLLMDRCNMDPKIKEQLAKFSSDLLHLKVGFTACDIVPLDRTLVAIISGTVVTYLIIFIQFRTSAPN
ncbi:putative gustatory receptor 28a isoform X1 [Microplitis demolitor]|uniref:putative gustatory receptor 28a isoform X1 n=2 Tax=Microplitis demolitor TaxID=69319 RepID=UPI0004CDD991|nr:putative gustatory receptor 28a isoform X1 [Microplitis demolitor]